MISRQQNAKIKRQGFSFSTAGNKTTNFESYFFTYFITKVHVTEDFALFIKL